MHTAACSIWYHPKHLSCCVMFFLCLVFFFCIFTTPLMQPTPGLPYCLLQNSLKRALSFSFLASFNLDNICICTLFVSSLIQNAVLDYCKNFNREVVSAFVWSAFCPNFFFPFCPLFLYFCTRWKGLHILPVLPISKAMVCCCLLTFSNSDRGSRRW